jgi:staphylococcal nuclease domain-containing protein 1
MVYTNLHFGCHLVTILKPDCQVFGWSLYHEHSSVFERIPNKLIYFNFRYSADNDRRSSHYDDLLAAEDKALKSAKGMHDKKNIPSRRIADISGDVNKSKQFFPFLQRAGRMQVK